MISHPLWWPLAWMNRDGRRPIPFGLWLFWLATNRETLLRSSVAQEPFPTEAL